MATIKIDEIDVMNILQTYGVRFFNEDGTMRDSYDVVPEIMNQWKHVSYADKLIILGYFQREQEELQYEFPRMS